MCSSEWWFVLYNGFSQPSLSNMIMSSSVVQGEHRFNAVRETWRLRLSRQEGHHLAFLIVSRSSLMPDFQPRSSKVSFFEAWQVFFRVSLEFGMERMRWVKCTVLIFVVTKEVEQESQRGLHLDYFKIFNVWLHYLKNKINKNPGDTAF